MDKDYERFVKALTAEVEKRFMGRSGKRGSGGI